MYRSQSSFHLLSKSFEHQPQSIRFSHIARNSLPIFSQSHGERLVSNRLSETNWMNCSAISIFKNKRWYAMPVVHREELKKLIEKAKATNKIEDREFILVDVREPYELEREGKIDTSINIPL
jgi:hypothetical protein